MKAAEILGAILGGLRHAWRFVTSEVWDVELTTLSPKYGFGVRAVRVVHLVIRGFREDECPMHASALTFSTLMSIVPVLAISLALARGLGGAEVAKSRIRQTVADWTQTFAVAAATNAPAAGEGSAETGAAGDGDFEPAGLAAKIETLVDDGFKKVENISFGALGGVGLVLLMWMVISVLGRVEASFNRVWGVSVGRSLWRKFTDYVSILMVLPILVVAASSAQAADFATRFLDEATAASVKDFLGSGALKNATVVIMTTLCFGFLIMFMPNTRVRVWPGLAGGFVAGLLFIGWMCLCAAIQVGAARYGKIYGGFAVVPIILAWVYVSWEIVLLGAEVAFAVQNCGTYRMEQGAEKASFRARMVLALSLVLEAARNMLGPGTKLDVAEYARRKRVPVRLLNDVVSQLVGLDILAKVSEGSDGYVLLKAPGSLPVHQILDAISRAGVKPEDLGLADVDPAIGRVVDGMHDRLDASLRDATVRDLLEARS